MNNENITKRRKKGYQSRLSRRIIMQYFFTLAGFIIFLFFLFFLSLWITSNIVWHPYEPLYRFLIVIKQHIDLIIGLICFAGWGFITYYFISKPLRYLDDLVTASEKLASPGADQIVLPAAMKNVQDELNLVRENAFRNALLAKEAEQRKNDLIVYLAHDLKTPLTSIIGYLTLLRDEPEISPGLCAKYTGIALDKAERLEDLINEFFDITRFNLTTLSLELERTNLSRMLEQITNEFSPILAEKGLCWKCDIAPNVELLCDRDKLERVFDNLIRNCLNYSYPETPIRLFMEQTEQGIEICIQNHGKTIPPEKLSHIFEQFYRVDSSRSSSTGGAGLGLAIAKEIVSLHGGTIRAESMNESITFTVLLPVLS